MTELTKNDYRIVRQGGYTEVDCNDDPGPGNACHNYNIISNDKKRPTAVLGHIEFQNGPIQENGVNGVQNEDLLAIVIDRLRGFQSGNFKCRENAIALAYIEFAMMWLEKRTADRQQSGVEGTNEK